MTSCATPLNPDALASDAQPKPAMRAPAGDIVAQTWQAEPIDCSSCPHQALLATQGCEPGHACMQDSYARRIDRFFRWHKELAARHLQHPYFEVRAIAARYTELFHLPALMNDVDETVRLQVALRLPQRLLQQMKQDPHREVRIRVAQRLDTDQLPAMVQDADYGVRQWVARRLTVALLPVMFNDREAVVRQEVAQRIEMPALLRMADDKDPGVRRIVAERLPSGLLNRLADDEDLLVRWEVIQRALPAVLQHMRQDPDPMLAQAAEARWAQLQHQPTRLEPDHG